ncbi:MAG: carboxypeptidase-like regulatory domain-containing protein [Bacteroidales bacterium]|nr:carboxypeptidase-like regulatory domain-containing protein [Bacteroidales bacterium]
MKHKITIVGPKPEKRSLYKRPEGAKFEALLLMAKYNKTFRSQLIADREKTLQDSGFDLDEKERYILQGIDNKQLLSTIRSFQVPGINKKSLSNWKTAAAVLLLITTISTKEAKSQAVIVDTANAESTPIVQGLTSDFYHMVISGSVFDSATHRPIIHARVSVKGKDTFVETDVKGNYSIRAAANDTLVFESFYHLKQEVVLISDLTEIDITLKKDEAKANLYKRGITPMEEPVQIQPEKKKKRK